MGEFVDPRTVLAEVRKRNARKSNSRPESSTSVDSPAPGCRLISRKAADITPKNIDFLWGGRLAKGKHTAIAGEPGDGKSQLSVYLAATISRGGHWPCDEGSAPLGTVIIFNAEDGAEDTIVPRLIAAGADMERVHIVSAVMQEDGKGRRTFNLQADLALLERKIVEVKDVVLVIMDPISSYMGKTDSHKNSEVRGALEPLSEMADRLGVAILSITHFSKSGAGSTSKALHRFIGSIAFVGAPRAAFAVVEDADTPGRMLVLHAKNNMAPRPQGLAYRLEQTIVCDNIVASRVFWESSPVAITADQALGASESRSNRSTRQEAEEFLRELLAGGPVPQPDIEKEAKGTGLSWATVRRAKEKLGVKSKKDGMVNGWHWSMPDASRSMHIPANTPLLPKVLNRTEGAHLGEVSTLKAVEHLRGARSATNGLAATSVASPVSDDGLGIPEFLRRCDHCGLPSTSADPLNSWDWPGRPEGIRLHGRCEAAFHDAP